MIDGNIRDFINNLYYGSAMFFEFDGKKYFIQGWYHEGMHNLVVDYAANSTGYIWKYSSKDSSECVENFLNARLWNGKKFHDVENEITWLEPI